MQGWIPDLGSVRGPKYLAIAEALSRDIDAGTLLPGERLLPQRALAEALGIDLTTVTRAYGEAQRLGLIEGYGRRGSFVRAKTGSVISPGVEDSGEAGMNAPPEGFGGSLAAAFRDCAVKLLSPEHARLPFQYQRTGGAAAARRAGAELLSMRNIPCSEDSVLVAVGGQNALHAIFSAEFRPGDAIGVCAFVYPGLLALARRFGVKLISIPSDGDGMDAAALDAACSRGSLRGVYIVPTNDNPTTVTMPFARRQAIAQIIEKRGLLLIEDDAYGLLPTNPFTPLAALAPERTWHVASISKILTPGLRVAWVRAPDVAGAWRLAADMHETAIMAPPLNAAVVTEWVRAGVFQGLIDEVRAEARARQQIAAACLPADAFQAQEYGYHLWVKASPDIDLRNVTDALRQHGLTAIPGEDFAADREAVGTRALRVSIGGAISRDRLQRGLLLLAALISQSAPRKVSLV